MTAKEEIVEKILKLLNMTTGNGCSIDEAANALRAVQVLLHKHNISDEDLDEKRKEEEITEVVMDTHIPLDRHFEWVPVLCWAISRITSCHLMIILPHTPEDGSPAQQKRVVWVGLPLDIDTSVKLFDYAVYQAKSTLRYKAENGPKNVAVQWAMTYNAYGQAMIQMVATPFFGGSVTPREEDSFLQGFAEGIARAIHDREQQDRGTTTTETSTMLAICDSKREDNVEHSRQLLERLGEEPAKEYQAEQSLIDPAAYREGVRVGSKTELVLRKELTQ